MTEQLIICPRCNSNACSEIINEKITIYTCMGCGFTTNSFLSGQTAKDYRELLPELYKDLEFVDIAGLHWYPLAFTSDNKSMVFVEGTSIDDWKWTAIKSKKTSKTLEDGSTIEIDTPDMTTKKEFERGDFIEALDFVGYFNLKQ